MEPLIHIKFTIYRAYTNNNNSSRVHNGGGGGGERARMGFSTPNSLAEERLNFFFI